jgi:hypothetical protein
MNNTKWDELRVAMYSIRPAPGFRCMMLNGNYSQLDSEWYYHFRDGGYGDIRYVDIFVQDGNQRKVVLKALKTVHVPGEELETGFRVFGYLENGQATGYL